MPNLSAPSSATSRKPTNGGGSGHPWTAAQRRNFNATMRKKKYGRGKNPASHTPRGRSLAKSPAATDFATRQLARRVKRLAITQITATGDAGDFEMAALSLANELLRE